jgi:CTD small phosphatase-like protein 2
MNRNKITNNNNKNNLFINIDSNSSKHSREKSEKIKHISLQNTNINTLNTYANTETYNNNKQIPNVEKNENSSLTDKTKIYVYKKNIIKNQNSNRKSPITSRNRNFFSNSKNSNNTNNNNYIKKYYTANNNTNSGLTHSSSTNNLNSINNIHKVSKFKINEDNTNKNNENKKTFINIEDLLLLEEKFTDIIFALNNQNLNLQNECFELFNFYNNSSLYNKFENYYKEPESKKLIHESITLILYIVILVYHLSFNKNFFITCLGIIKILIDYNHKSYLILCEYILSKVSSSQRDNIWVIKLKNMLKLKLNHINLNNKDFIQYLSNRDSNSLLSINEIGFYSYNISNYIRVILKNNKTDDLNSDFIKFFKNINSVGNDDISNFFRKKIIRVLNKNASIMGSDINPLESSNLIKVPYIEKNSLKEFTLVLDLDETLISFKTDPYEETKGLLRFRPYLYQFLDKVIQYYELIIFTSATKDYADPILDEIENSYKNYFDYRLYRHHTIVYNNDFVKDISRIGRDLKKTIIVDNLPQNFRLQKENGIFIKAFWGEDIYDNALLNLAEILEKIALNYNDVTKGILDFKDEILNKVSSNFSRN